MPGRHRGRSFLALVAIGSLLVFPLLTVRANDLVVILVTVLTESVLRAGIHAFDALFALGGIAIAIQTLLGTIDEHS